MMTQLVDHAVLYASEMNGMKVADSGSRRGHTDRLPSHFPWDLAAARA